MNEQFDCERCKRFNDVMLGLERTNRERSVYGLFRDTLHRVRMWWRVRAMPLMGIGPVPYSSARFVSTRPLNMGDVIAAARLGAIHNWKDRITARREEIAK